MEPCVSCFYLTYCMEYDQQLMLLTDNIQSGGSCSVNYY